MVDSKRDAEGLIPIEQQQRFERELDRRVEAAQQIRDPEHLERVICSFTTAQKMTAAEAAEFLLAILTNLLVGEHLADPDLPEAAAIAGRVAPIDPGEANWAIGQIGMLLANNAGCVRFTLRN